MNARTGQAILAAISKEATAHAFYQAAALKARNPLVRRRLLGLADDEAQHQETLSRLYWSQTGKEPGQVAAGPLPSGEDPGALDLPAVLRMAIREEDQAAAEYARMADDAGDGRVRLFLEYLVDLEKGHSRALSEELARIEKYPDWQKMTEGG